MPSVFDGEDEARLYRMVERILRQLPRDNYTQGRGRVAETDVVVRRLATTTAGAAPAADIDGAPVGGDLTGTLPNPTVDGLQGNAVGTATPTDGQVLTYSTANAQWEPDDAGSGSSPLTTKGDVYVYGTADARLPVGSDDQVLTADSSQALGVKWADASGGGATSNQPPITYGLTLFLDARSLDGPFSESDDVSYWFDESNRGNDANTVGNNPSFGTAETSGGEPAVTFDDSNSEGLDLPANVVDIQSGTSFVVMSPASSHTGFALSYRQTTSSNDRWYVLCIDDDILVQVGSSSTQAAVTAFTNDTWHTIALRADGNNKEVWANGTSIATFTNSQTGTPDEGFLGVGAPNGNSNYFDGRIACVLHYGWPLSDSQVDTINTWLEDQFL